MPAAAAPLPPPDLDARYVSFPPVGAWVEASPELDLFGAAAEELRQLTTVVGPEQAESAVEVAVRAAAFDTGAIEGLYPTDRGVTFTVAERAAAWEAVAAREAGPDAVRHFRAQLAGFELVLDAATGAAEITSAWLRALHETICGAQDTFRALTAAGWQEQSLPKGELKRGSWHSYAPPDRTPAEVQRLVDELRSPGFQDAHPVVQAAFAHHAFVSVHPFVDGNGRVARALSSVFLYRAARVPLHIWADQRGRYLDALRAADAGDRAAFVRFVRDVTVDTIRLVVLRLRPAARRAVPAEARRRDQVSAVVADDTLFARRVLTAVADRVRAAGGTVVAGDRPPTLPGHEPVPEAGVINVSGSSLTAAVAVLRPAGPGSPYPFALVGDGVPALPLRRDQLDPAITEVTSALLAAWADDLWERLCQNGAS